jgi:hypothetical protein
MRDADVSASCCSRCLRIEYTSSLRTSSGCRGALGCRYQVAAWILICSIQCSQGCKGEMRWGRRSGRMARARASPIINLVLASPFVGMRVVNSLGYH